MSVNFQHFMHVVNTFVGCTLRILYLDHASSKTYLTWRAENERFQLYTVATLRTVRSRPTIDECIRFQITPRSFLFTFDNRLRLSLPGPSIATYKEQRSALRITLKKERTLLMVPLAQRE